MMIHKTFLMAGLVVLCGASLAMAQAISVNITSGNGSMPDTTANGVVVEAPFATGSTVFNDIGNFGGGGANLLDADGNESEVGFTVDLNGNSNFSFSQDENPNAIIQNYWAGNIGFAGGPPANTSTITFTGLGNNLSWDLYFIAQGDTDGQGTIFQIGSDIQMTDGSDADGSENLSPQMAEGVNFAMFDSVVSSAAGEISVDLTALNGEFVILNGFQLVPDGTDPIATCDVDGVNGCNSTDFNIILNNLFTDGARGDGDLDGNGTIDFFDYRVFKDDVTRTLGAGAFAAILAGAAVPEPTSMALLTICSLVVLSSSRRTARCAHVG